MDLIVGEGAEELLRFVIDDGVEFFEKRKPAWGDARPDDTTVSGIATLCDEFAKTQAREQTGDVWLGGDHAVADGRAGESCGGRGAENAQDVVLRMRELEGAQSKLKGAIELI